MFFMFFVFVFKIVVTLEVSWPCVKIYPVLVRHAQATPATRMSEEPLLLLGTETTKKKSPINAQCNTVDSQQRVHRETIIFYITLGRQSPYFSRRPLERHVPPSTSTSAPTSEGLSTLKHHVPQFAHELPDHSRQSPRSPTSCPSSPRPPTSDPFVWPRGKNR